MEGGGLSPRHLARTAPGLLRLGQYLSPLSPRPRLGISPLCSPECEGSRWEQPQQAEDAVTGRSPGVVSGWSIHGQSEPVAPGVQQGKAGPGSLARRPRGAWDGLGREVLPRLLWRLWVWRGQLCGRGTRGWAQHTRIACGNRPGRGPPASSLYQEVTMGPH